jgi:hypothetical protein
MEGIVFEWLEWNGTTKNDWFFVLWWGVVVVWFLYGIITLLSATSVVVSVVMTIALIAIFPAGLFALGFFKPTELGEIREFMARTLPGVVKPVESSMSKNEKNESATDRID